MSRSSGQNHAFCDDTRYQAPDFFRYSASDYCSELFSCLLLSVIVRTYALKAVDWEERLGLGMETSRGNDWHAGDGGLLARFSDGTVTDST